MIGGTKNPREPIFSRGLLRFCHKDFFKNDLKKGAWVAAGREVVSHSQPP